MTISLPTHVAPIPGNPATIRSKAARFNATADAIREAVSGLRAAIADTKQHESDALDKLAENARKVSDRLNQLRGRYETASQALTSFATDLESAQREAQRLVDEHADALRSEGSYERQIAYYREQRQQTTDPVEAADINRHLLTLTQRRDGMAAQAAGTQARFTRIVDDLRQSGGRASREMRACCEGDGFNDSTWDDFSGWVADHAGILKTIHGFLQGITLALSVLSFFIPVLAPFALAAAAITAGLGLVLAATGQMSWIDFALDVLTVATMGVAAVAARTIAGVMTALKGTRAARLTAQGVSNPLRVVTGSFNGVLKGRNGLALFGGKLKLPSTTWAREVSSAKGLGNAHFLRVAQSAKAGAGGPLDDILLRIGREEMMKIRVAAAVTTGVKGVDTGLGRVLPAGLDFFGDTAHETPLLGDAARWYEGVKDAATWRIGS
ncbi:MAG: hypothetical protein QM622_06890 [Microbacterium sp.]